MDAVAIISTVLSVIGGATVLLRMVAPLTKTQFDNKVLKILEDVLGVVSLDSKVVEGKKTTFLNIKLKR